MRLFVALDFEELRSYFKGLQDKLPDIGKITRTNHFHLTMKFLGEIEESEVPKIKKRLAEIKHTPLTCTLDNIGVFPDVMHPRVIWVGVKEDVHGFQKKIHSTLKEYEDSERFHAHITLARVKTNDGLNLFEQLQKIPVENKKLEINSFQLLASELTPEGPRYKEICKFSLEA